MLREYPTKTYLRVFDVAHLLGIEGAYAYVRAHRGDFGPLVELLGQAGRFVLRAEVEARFGVWTDEQVAEARAKEREKRKWPPKYSRSALEALVAAAIKQRDDEWLSHAGSPPTFAVSNYLPPLAQPPE